MQYLPSMSCQALCGLTSLACSHMVYCLGTKLGFMPCETWAAARESYIPGCPLSATAVSGFFLV